MKKGTILIFISSIIAALALLCAVFPEGGVDVGAIHLNFPEITDILGEQSRTDMDVEVLDMPEGSQEPENPLLEFIRHDPSAFSLPGGDISFFDRFFERLETASSEPVRVIHYGDSQIEEDRITSRLRIRLQERFGGSGPGMLPVRDYYTGSIGVSADRELDRFMIFGDSTMRARDGRYGPYASFSRLDTAVNVVFSSLKNRSGNATSFEKATLVAGNVRGGFVAAGADSVYTLSSGGPLELLDFNLADSTKRFSLRLSGHADLYGLLLDGRGGVSVDNVPMRGCSGTVFTGMNREQLSNFYEKANVGMIMLQYGGNSVPYIRSEDALQTYVEALGRQIERVAGLAPGAAIVFIGPSDMSTTIGGKKVTYPMLPALVDSLRAEANRKGAAYWSIYDVMGGEGSMASWVKMDPALASSDYIHFTSRGAVKVGDILADALMSYYEYYIWRKENE